MEQLLASRNSPYPSMSLFFELLTAPVKWAVLEAALELDIADILTETGDLTKIAQKIGVQADLAGLVAFLDAIVALGLANKKDNTYSNTELARHFMCKKSPVYMGTLLHNLKAMQHKNLTRIVEIIKNGPPEIPKTESLQNESKWERSVTHLAAYQRAGMGAICADLVESIVQGHGIKKILDIGGGPGLIGAEILRRFPESKGVLFDLPAIIQLAKKEIEKEKMGDRISCISGDYNETDIGNDYDLIWASHNLYYVKDRVAFFKRVKKSLTKNGVFICLHEGLSCERTAPADIVLMRLSLSLEGQDFSFAKGEIATDLQEAGFLSVKSKLLQMPAGEVELVTAK